VYVELIRNTPFIVQLFFVFFGLPAAWAEAHAGAGLGDRDGDQPGRLCGGDRARRHRGHAARADRGRAEPGADRAQVFVRVVLPPALAKVWPAMVSQIIIVMLGSAVCGQISTEELSYAANLIQSRNFRAFEAYIVATLVYLLLSIGAARGC
jgi:polar amino acid transport system permease protein